MRPDPIVEAGLRGDPLVGVGGRGRATGEARALDRRVAGDEPHLVAGVGEPALDELDRLDDDGRSARASSAAVDRARGSAAGRPGWTIASRSRSAVRIREDDPAEACPIERSVVAAQAVAEPGDDRLERRLTRLDDVARDLVGVDDDDTGPFAEPAARRSTSRSRWVRSARC